MLQSKIKKQKKTKGVTREKVTS